MSATACVSPRRLLGGAIVLAFCGALGCVPAAKSSSRASSFIAVIESYESDAEWEHYDDGSFSNWDRMQVRLLNPSVLKDRRLSIRLSAQTLPPDSPLRRKEATFLFQMSPALLEQQVIDWGDLQTPQPLQ